MPRLRKSNASATPETPPAETQLRTGTKMASEQQLHNYEALETEINEPVEIDISEDSDAGPEAPVEPKASREKDEGALAAQARESKQAEESIQRAQEETRRAREAYERQQTAYQQERYARTQADYDALVSQTSSWQADYEAAQRAYIDARQANDFGAEATAQGRMATAAAKLQRLEETQSDYIVNDQGRVTGRHSQPQQAPAQAPPAQRSVRDIVNSMTALIPEERQWIIDHPDVVSTQARVQELQGAYAAAQRQGLTRGTQEYFDFFEERLGLSDEPARPTKPAKPVRAQAPVSRGTTDLRSGRTNEGSKITLSAQQRQAAQWSGISEHEYARELKKLQDFKSRGYYTDNQ